MASNEDIPDKEPIVPQSMQVRKLLFFQQDSEILLQDRYLLKKKIGSGGMGEIFKGIDIKNNNFEIAVKRLFSSEPIARQRFEREYQLLTNIQHPNFVQAYDYFEYNGDCYMVLEFVHGETLRGILEADQAIFTLSDQIIIAIQLAQAIDALNSTGVIHRDIKPSNIMINLQTGNVKLLDLGVGKNIYENTHLTQTGVGVGSIAYTSPEQLSGEDSNQMDIFSLGVTLYQFFAWETQSPFQGTSYYTTAMKIVEYNPPPLLEVIEASKPNLTNTEREIYQLLSETIQIALEKKPRLRWGNGNLLANKLQEIYHLWAKNQTSYTSQECQYHDGDKYKPEDLKEATYTGRDFLVKTIEKSILNVPQTLEKFILVIGEDGLGKTRLLEELQKRFATKKLHFVIFHYSFETEPDKPFQPIVKLCFDMFQQLNILKKDDYIYECPINYRADYIESYFCLADEATMMDIFVDSNQDSYFAGVGCYIRAHAKTQPLCIILDNIHYLDRRSADWLQYFFYSLKENDNIIILATYRGDDQAGENNIQRILPSLRSRKNFQEYTLQPLLNRNIVAYIQSILDPVELSSDDIVTIFKITQGKPYLINDFLFNLASNNQITWENQKWHLDFDQGSLSKPPKALEEQLIRDYVKLPKYHRQILEWISLAEFPLSFNILCVLTDLKITHLPYILGDLLKERYIIEVGETTEKIYDNTSNNISHEIVQQLDFSSKKKMHLELAKLLEKEKDNLQLYRRAAVNYYEGGDYKKAITIYWDAARIFWKEKQFNQSIQLYKNAVTLGRETGLKDLCTLLVEFAYQLYEMNDYQTALDHFQEASMLEVKDKSEQIRKGKGMCLYGLRKYEQAQKELKNIESTQDHEDLDILLTLASLELSKYNVKKASQHLEKAKELIPQNASDSIIATYKKNEAILKFYQGEWSEAESLFDEAEQLSLWLPTNQQYMEIVLGRSYLTSYVYGSNIALDTLLSVIAYGDETEDFFLQFQSNYLAVLASLDQGKIQDAQKYSERLLQINQKKGSRRHQSYAILAKGLCELANIKNQNANVTPEKTIQEALTIANDCGEQFVSAEAYAALSQIYRYAKRYKNSHTYINYSKNIFIASGLQWKANRLATLHARIYTIEKKPQVAMTVLVESEKYAKKIGDNYHLADNYFEQAFILGRTRKIPEAIKFFNKAATLYTNMGRTAMANDSLFNAKRCQNLLH